MYKNLTLRRTTQNFVCKVYYRAIQNSSLSRRFQNIVCLVFLMTSLIARLVSGSQVIINCGLTDSVLLTLKCQLRTQLIGCGKRRGNRRKKGREKMRPGGKRQKLLDDNMSLSCQLLQYPNKLGKGTRGISLCLRCSLRPMVLLFSLFDPLRFFFVFFCFFSVLFLPLFLHSKTSVVGQIMVKKLASNSRNIKDINQENYHHFCVHGIVIPVGYIAPRPSTNARVACSQALEQVPGPAEY